MDGFLNMKRVVEGTVFGRNELRITKIDGYPIDLPPSENMILFNNRDAPGVLKRVVEVLARSRVNIAHFSLGRKADSEQYAMCALVVDDHIDDDTMAKIKKLTEVQNVIRVSMCMCMFMYMLICLYTHE